MLRNSYRCSFLALAVSLSSIAFADDPVPAKANGHADCHLAVIDVAQVFKQHIGFNAQQAALKMEIEEFEKQMRQRTIEIEILKKQLAQLAAGTEPFENLERQISELATSLQVDATLKKKRVMEKEGRLYAKVYAEVQAEVARVAKEKRIRLVVRYQSDLIDKDDRDSILKGVNRRVVFHDNIDITAEVAERLNRRAKAKNQQAKRQ